jgi:hypothetical protein
MSSKETQPSIDFLTSETKEFFELLSEEIHKIYKEHILNDKTNLTGSSTKDVTEQDDYKNFVKTKLESVN